MSDTTVISEEGVVTEVAGTARDTAPRGRTITAPRHGATRLLVTGIGVVAPTGIGVEEHWQALLRGELAVRPIEGFDAEQYGVTVAGQVRDFDAEQYIVPQLKVQTDRWSWMSLAAATLAAEDAGYIPPEEAYATSVFLAAGSGGNEFSQHEIQRLWSRGPRSVGAYQSIAWFYAASTGQVSIRDGYKGPSGVVVSEGAGGLDSIGWARRVARRGTPAVLVGGTEAGVTPYALLCQVTSGRLSTAPRPEDAYKPFDRRANGQVIGEGGAILLLEEADAAAGRGAQRIWGEVVGYAATHDAHHHEDPAPDATQYTRAIRLALADAGVAPDEVGMVIADGAGIPELDALEATAITAVFGERGVPVTVPSSWTGRLMAGGSALNVATALLAMRDGLVPPTGNVEEPVESYGLDLVRETREADLDVVVVLARGFGGFNSALVLRRHRAEEAA
ncbi:beta-ketoacyl synthase N-terminal-like domain-containing protein [Geodermatophilus sp. DSM 44513]|uniref:beta-ketoacyl synthase N-terminal-like domain-containing protein n=1 Tax=Geodermatophilus sp. DSM 44513 TaxID=1528104 RepID=UPI001271D5DE|nr:beta-ketoacyl synthase N-terminal-like domain-containing protein [Geodermatophilus sp. DSM 44513]WNV75803.1 beta-ketoacyl synthase N-terminal-like domain-containing protein [Geodermatophilus sp. DSM 44513]